MIYSGIVRAKEVYYVGFTKSGSYSVISVQICGRSLNDNFTKVIVPIPGVVMDSYISVEASGFILDGLAQSNSDNFINSMLSTSLKGMKEPNIHHSNDLFQICLPSFKQHTLNTLHSLFKGWEFIIIDISDFDTTSLTMPVTIVYDSIKFKDSSNIDRIYVPFFNNKTVGSNNIYSDSDNWDYNNIIGNESYILIGAESLFISDELSQKIHYTSQPNNRIIDDHCHLLHIKDKKCMNGDLFISQKDFNRYAYTIIHLSRILNPMHPIKILY